MTTDCQTCGPATCNDPDNVLIYSLENVQVTNPDLAFSIPCPAGADCLPGIYPKNVTIPAGSVVMNVPPASSIGNGPLRLLGCQCEIIVDVPDGATDADLLVLAQGMVATWAQQQAFCIVAANP